MYTAKSPKFHDFTSSNMTTSVADIAGLDYLLSVSLFVDEPEGLFPVEVPGELFPDVEGDDLLAVARAAVARV
jgi:hypothetical protein